MTNKQKLLLTFLTVSFLSGCGMNIFGPMALIKEDSNTVNTVNTVNTLEAVPHAVQEL